MHRVAIARIEELADRQPSCDVPQRQHRQRRGAGPGETMLRTLLNRGRP